MNARPHRETNQDGSRIVAGKYRLLSILGRGGMGTVWRAEHLQLGGKVAVKLIDPNAAGGADALRQCQKEARAAAALRSPHVVQMLDFGEDDATGSPFIVMELLEGESLADRLGRRGKLSLQETSRVLTHVARALGRAHDDAIIHRDLKPANVFMVRDDDEELAKVLDFGTARVQRADMLGASMATTGGLVGTPYYMSPEHISAQAVDHRTDLWAMAVMAFECVAGRRPFDATDIGQLVLQICTYPIPVPSAVATVPAGFDVWFQRATRRELDHRFQSARELADDLRRICLEMDPGSVDAGVDGGVAIGAVRAGRDTFRLPPPTERAASPPRPRRTVWWFGGCALLVVALAATTAGKARVPDDGTSDPASAATVLSSAPLAAPAHPVTAADAAVKPTPRLGSRKPRVRQAAAPPVRRPESAVLTVESVLDHRR
jgi:serine/threonine protein kinase